MFQRGQYGFENFPSALDRSLTKAKASLLCNLDYSMSCLYLKVFLSFVLLFTYLLLNVFLVQDAAEAKIIQLGR